VPAADPDLPSSRSNVQPAGASTESWRIGASPRSVKNEGIREDYTYSGASVTESNGTEGIVQMPGNSGINLGSFQVAQEVLMGQMPPWIEELTPLEEIPPGAAGGPRSGMNFPRNLGKPQPGDPCIYCGNPATSRDHIIPKSQGGDGTIDNLGRTCVPCNSSKGGRTPAQWYNWMGVPPPA
jgi:hypothetical protein